MIDLTSVSLAVIAGTFPIFGTIISYMLQTHMKDTKAAKTLSDAIENSLGAIQQAAESSITSRKPTVNAPWIPANLLVGLQYVLDHAGAEAERLGITQMAIVEKIEAKIGLANIKSNISAASSPTLPVSPLASAAHVASLKGIPR